MFRNVEICSFVIKLPRFHCPGKLPTFACRYTYHSFRSLSSFPEREAPAQRVPESDFVTSLAQNFIVVGFCGYFHFVWENRSVAFPSLGRSVPLLPLLSSSLSSCLSEPSAPPPDTAFFSVISLPVRKTFSPTPADRDGGFLPGEVTSMYLFLVSGFWPKIASL